MNLNKRTIFLLLVGSLFAPAVIFGSDKEGFTIPKSFLIEAPGKAISGPARASSDAMKARRKKQAAGCTDPIAKHNEAVKKQQDNARMWHLEEESKNLAVAMNGLVAKYPSTPAPRGDVGRALASILNTPDCFFDINKAHASLKINDKYCTPLQFATFYQQKEIIAMFFRIKRHQVSLSALPRKSDMPEEGSIYEENPFAIARRIKAEKPACPIAADILRMFEEYQISSVEKAMVSFSVAV